MPLGVVKLDRLAMEEAGPNPERIAASIHAQLALLSGPVPIHQVAEALDIVEIRQAPLKGLEGALVSAAERDIGLTDLTSVLRLSKTLDLSREASARRYVQLHDQPTALVFSVDGVVRYVQRNPDFPSVLYQPGQRLSELLSPVDKSRLSAHEEADPRDWLVRPGRDALIVQTLSQSRGHATTLLALDVAGSDEDDL